MRRVLLNFCILLSLLFTFDWSSSSCYSNTLVVPADLEKQEAPTYVSVFCVPIRYQELFNSTNFPFGRLKISELRFRPDIQYGSIAGAFSTRIPRLQVRLSTSSRSPGGLSRRFVENVGADESLVFDGEWDFATSYAGPPSGPKLFDIILKLQKPFVYDSRLGSLLVEFRTFSRAPAVYVHDGFTRYGVAERILAEDPEATVAQGGDQSGAVMQIVYAPESAPPVIVDNPKDITAIVGEDVSFQSSVFGSEPIYYQWLKDGKVLDMATNASLILTNVDGLNTGKYSIVASNFFGKAVGTEAKLDVVTGSGPNSELVIPRVNREAEGNTYASAFCVPVRYQELYPTNDFPKATIRINKLTYRPDVQFGVSQGAFSIKIPRVQIRMSTSSKTPGQLSARFSDNVGLDETVVFDGEWTFETKFEGPDNGPKAFDITLPFNKSFLFDARKGNLLVEIRTFSRLGPVFVQDAVSGLGVGERKFVENPDGELAAGGDMSVSVVKLGFVPAVSAPGIDQQPLGAVLLLGESHDLEVKAYGAEPLHYQWFFQGEPLLDSTNALLRLTNVKLDNVGKYKVEVTNRLGKIVSDDANLQIDLDPRIETFLPADLENIEGNGWFRFLDGGMRLQEIYQFTELPKIPIVIKELRLRPDAGYNTSGSSNLLSRVQVRISTTTRPVANLSYDFASNVGTNEVIVFDGPLILNTKFEGPPNGPKKADIVLRFKEFFRYSPDFGNLIIEVRNYGSLPIPFAHDSVLNDFGQPLRQFPVKAVYSTGSATAAFAQDEIAGASVYDLVYSIEPIAPILEKQPVGGIFEIGENIQISALALGTQPLTYQWFKNGDPIIGATNSAILIPTVASTDSGEYTVLVSNPLGSVLSQPARVVVDAEERLVRAIPSGLEEIEGNDSHKNLGVIGRFQYAYDSVELPGGPITIKELRFRPDAGFTNQLNSGTSARVQLRLSTMRKVAAGLSKDFTSNIGFDEKTVFTGRIQLKPSLAGPDAGPKESDIVIRFDDFFEYNPALGSLLVDLRSFDSLPIPLIVDSVDNFVGSPIRQFTVRTASNLGTADSTEATTIGFGAPVIGLIYTPRESVPVFAQHPERQIAVAATPVRLVSRAVGSEPIAYQWLKGGVAVQDATNAVLEFPSVAVSDAGDYAVLAINRLGSTSSLSATLTVDAEPRLENIFPLGLDVLNGTDFRNTFDEPFRMQEAYQASEFPQMPMTIKSLSFRPDAEFMAFPISNYVSRIQVRISTMKKAVGDLSLVFTNNPGSDEKVVFDGPLSFSTAFEGPIDGPKKADLTIPFKDFFVYDPKVGNLLIEVRSYDRLSRWLTQDAVDNRFAPFPRTYPVKTVLYSGLAEADSANTSSASASIIRLVYSVASNVSPAILLQPQSAQVEMGNDASFAVTAVGSSPLNYQWYHNDVPIAGETNRALLLTNITSIQGGFYSVSISNSVGMIVSENAGLATLAAKTTLRLIDTQTASGGEVIVPVQLVANGSENAVAFSIFWDRRSLIYQGLASIPAIPNVSVNINTNDQAVGRMGFAFALPAGQVFPSGQQLLAQLKFKTYAALLDQTAFLNFIPFPIAIEAVDTRARQLPLRQISGEVSILYKGFEGEVSPRPFSDRRVTLSDWVQVGRFVAALDAPRNGEEFQRADCAPKDEAGDGVLTVRDWVQAGRFASALDGISAAGGPLVPVVIAPPPPGPAPQGPNGADIELSTVSGAVGSRVKVPMTLGATGFESALGFSISYDAQKLTFVGAYTGKDAVGASLNVNTNSPGTIGCALAFSSAFPLSPGKRQVVVLEFEVGSVSAGDIPLAFGDHPVVRELANLDADLLPSNFIAGTIKIAVGTPVLGIAQSNTALVLSWAVTPGTTYKVESLNSLANSTWTAVQATPVLGANNVWTVEVPWTSTANQYFRLKSVE